MGHPCRIRSKIHDRLPALKVRAQLTNRLLLALLDERQPGWTPASVGPY